MKRTMNEVEGLTFDGILKLSESKFGTKYTMKIMDVLYLHHLKSRGICGSSKDEMKSYLMREGYDSRNTLKMIKRYSKVQDDLFEYTHRVQSIMDRVNSYGDSKFRPILLCNFSTSSIFFKEGFNELYKFFF